MQKKDDPDRAKKNSRAHDNGRASDAKKCASSIFPYYLSRWCFLRGIGFFYLVAFASLYVQIKGTLGHDGIMPIDVYMERVTTSMKSDKYLQAPSLLWYMTEHLPLTADGASHILCLLGMSVSALIVLGVALSPLMVVAWLCYLSLYSVGQNFLSFQWDTLLLESGLLAIFLAPLWSTKRYFHDVAPSPVTNWMLRWLLFRLMFASGAVKLASQCPTWWGLTALHYHYETQCIPLPMAWYAHHLSDAFQRLSVVLTFVIELLVPFWIFIPHRVVSIAVAFIQIFLQLLIILTGNYNFFNYLTILLCLPLLDDAFLSTFLPTWRSSFGPKAKSTWRSFLWNLVGWLLLLAAAGVSGWITFLAVKVDWSAALSVDAWLSPPDLHNPRPMFALAFDQSQWNSFVAQSIPASLVAGAVLLALSSTFYLVQTIYDAFSSNPQQPQQQQPQPQQPQPKKKKNKKNNKKSAKKHSATPRQRGWGRLLWRILVGLVRVACIVGVAGAIFALSTVPYSHLARETHNKIPPTVLEVFKATQGFHVVANYGLFARMTTSRPEIIIEGSNDSVTWLPYEFKYKAGALDRSPPFVAPHQPRLDWQMWFASLGNYQNNPWFIHFVTKLLTNTEEVVDLLASNPFPHSPPRLIRAQVWDYHFTRPSNESLWGDITSSLSAISVQGIQPVAANQKPWWTRTFKQEYIPILGLPNAHVEDFLAHFGWKVNVPPLQPQTEAERWLLTSFYAAAVPFVPWVVIQFGVLALFV